MSRRRGGDRLGLEVGAVIEIEQQHSGRPIEEVFAKVRFLFLRRDRLALGEYAALVAVRCGYKLCNLFLFLPLMKDSGFERSRPRPQSDRWS